MLEHVTPASYIELTTRAQAFGRDLEAAIQRGGIGARVVSVGPLLGLYVGSGRDPIETPTNYVEAKAIIDQGIYPLFFHALLRRGVAMAPGAYEIMFVSMSHSDEILAEVVAKATEASLEVAASR